MFCQSVCLSANLALCLAIQLECRVQSGSRGAYIVDHIFVFNLFSQKVDHATCLRACNFDVTSTGPGRLRRNSPVVQ